MLSAKEWYQLEGDEDSVKDDIMHVMLPILLSAIFLCLGTKEELRKDSKVKVEYSHVKKVLGALSQGVALVRNFRNLNQDQLMEMHEDTDNS